MTRAIALAALAALAACFTPQTTRCTDGTTCPESTVCAPAGGGCVDPSLVASCAGKAENANCTAVTSGVCQQGVCGATTWQTTVLIGGQANATTSQLVGPQGVALDRSGNLYIADSVDQRIRRVDTAGFMTTIAGTGTQGYAGDGGPAVEAELDTPEGLAVDGLGRVYIADRHNNRIRRIDTEGVITTVAGSGPTGGDGGYSGDGGPATSAELYYPAGVAVDGLGDLYIADSSNDRIRRVDTAGVITTVAGTGGLGAAGDGSAATSAELNLPYGVALDAIGNIYIADTNNERVRRVDTAGVITTIAGTGSTGFGGDGGAATGAQLNVPYAVTTDGQDVYIADTNNNRIRRVDSAGMITTVAGGGNSEDGGLATDAKLLSPQGIVVGELGMYIPDTVGNIGRVWHVDSAGVIATVAGGRSIIGDGAGATAAQLGDPLGVAIDALGEIYVADTGYERIRRIDRTGVITTVAGNGIFGYGGDGSAATAAELSSPGDLAIDGVGNLYIADTSNHRIRRVDPNGTITTVAGTGTGGYSGDGGAATAAKLFFPYGVAVDGAGNLYIADTYNQRIRRVDTSGEITTVAGVGTLGYSGDGSAATAAQLHYPHGVAIDKLGNLYIADTYNHSIRRVDPTGIITTVAGVGTSGFSGDGSAAAVAELNAPTHIVVDQLGNLDIADSQNYRIRRVDTGGVISTVAGMGDIGFTGDGDGGPAIAASLEPIGIAVDTLGQIYNTDVLFPSRIQRVDVAGIITTVAGPMDPSGVGPLAQARLADPEALVVAAPFQLVAAGTSGTLEAISATSLDVVAGRYPNDPGVVTTNLARFRDKIFGDVGGVAFDGVASIYLTESNPAEAGHEQVHVVTVTDPGTPETWTIADLASGSAGDQDGPIATAELSQPTGLYRDPTTGVVYVADTGNNVIRAIDAAGANISTFAGAARTSGGFSGDGGPASSALFAQPHAITRCPNGDFFIADTFNHRVRRIAGDGTITTVLGDGATASSGEGAPANTFAVDYPRGLACDDLGNVFVTSTSTVRMLLADDTGVIDGTGSVRTIYGAPPRTTFPASATQCLRAVAIVDVTHVRITDSCTGMLIELERVPAP